MYPLTQIRRVSKTTKGGRHPSVSVFVVVGNGNGAAGYALGKGETVADATLKASLRAVKRMQAFHRCGDRTLPHRVEQKLGATRVQLWPLPAGTVCARPRTTHPRPTNRLPSSPVPLAQGLARGRTA